MEYPVIFEINGVAAIQAIMRVGALGKLCFEEPKLLEGSSEAEKGMVEDWHEIAMPAPDAGAVKNFDTNAAHWKPGDRELVIGVSFLMMRLAAEHRLFFSLPQYPNVGMSYPFRGKKICHLIKVDHRLKKFMHTLQGRVQGIGWMDGLEEGQRPSIIH